MHLTIINHSGRPVPRAFLEDWVRRIDRKIGRRLDPGRYRGRELVLVFLSEAEAKRLNQEYRGRSYATDVLSFESLEPDSLGELVISPDVIKRQAKEHGLLIREELGYMVLHGFLHLLGYDHEKSDRAAKAMFKIQDEVFEELLKRPRPRSKSRRALRRPRA